MREAGLIACSVLALYLFLALVSYTPSDPAWSHSHTVAKIYNLGGITGAWFADIFFYLFGYLAYLFPVMVAFSGWLILRGRRAEARRQQQNSNDQLQPLGHARIVCSPWCVVS